MKKLGLNEYACKLYNTLENYACVLLFLIVMPFLRIGTNVNWFLNRFCSGYVSGGNLR